MWTALSAWIARIIPFDKIPLVLAAFLLSCCLWCYVAMIGARSDAAAARADNAKLTVSVKAGVAAIAALQRDIEERDAVIKQRDARITALHAAGMEAAAAIQGAANDDNPECNIDARLPRALSDPLRVLYAKTAGRDHTADTGAMSAGNTVPAKTDAGTAGNIDRSQSREMGGGTGRVGR